MSTFDPVTYSMAREAKLPAGALLASMSADPALVGSGWAHLDGSLVSRAQYPNARNVLGDRLACVIAGDKHEAVNEVA